MGLLIKISVQIYNNIKCKAKHLAHAQKIIAFFRGQYTKRSNTLLKADINTNSTRLHSTQVIS